MAVTVALKTRLNTRQLDSIRHGRRFISPGEREAAYVYAYYGLAAISERLDAKTVHYWHCDGPLLTTLDEVVRALEDGELREAA